MLGLPNQLNSLPEQDLECKADTRPNEGSEIENGMATEETLNHYDIVSDSREHEVCNT